jgi:hypothetical protein
MGLSPVEQELVNAAVAGARRVAAEGAMVTRAGIVMEVDPLNATALVAADGPDSGSFGADIVAPVTLFPGDRVMLLFAPPHGAMVIGRRSGDFDDWHVVGDEGEPQFTGWETAAGTVGPGQNGQGVVMFTRRSGVTYLQGQAARLGGGGSGVFELPEGYRPYTDLVLRTSSGTSGGGFLPVSDIMTIDQATGLVSANGPPDRLWLDGISFPAAVPAVTA